MNLDWQDTTAMLLVAAAACYVGRRGWLLIAAKRKGGCAAGCDCGRRPTNEPGRDRQLVPVETLVQSARRK